MSQQPISHCSQSSRGLLPSNGRSIGATKPEEVTKLEKTYKSPITIALPVDKKEYIKQIQALALATLHQKGTHTSPFLQQIRGQQNGINAKNITHTLWVGRSWDSMLYMFDSIIRDLGKQQPAFEPFKPHGLIVLLKTGYS
jgi:hypothetical protein